MTNNVKNILLWKLCVLSYNNNNLKTFKKTLNTSKNSDFSAIFLLVIFKKITSITLKNEQLNNSNNKKISDKERSQKIRDFFEAKVEFKSFFKDHEENINKYNLLMEILFKDNFEDRLELDLFISKMSSFKIDQLIEFCISELSPKSKKSSVNSIKIKKNNIIEIKNKKEKMLLEEPSWMAKLYSYFNSNKGLENAKFL
ncbi:hypothetical protein [Mesoplasma florum]|uniref:hypothetical protein n=1 Tax=Mesoplasma florum TaxID=2151 RepID=UPI000D031960|nr:hypothetical protein [Mesoplasma florum]AVN58945.1 hypothetical protein CG009_01740 [Mesoplasma florum]